VMSARFLAEPVRSTFPFAFAFAFAAHLASCILDMGHVYGGRPRI
jgi:hypothetical protein